MSWGSAGPGGRLAGRTGRRKQNGSVQGRGGKQSASRRTSSRLSEKVLTGQVADLGEERNWAPGQSGPSPPGPTHQSSLVLASSAPPCQGNVLHPVDANGEAY